MKEFIKRHLAFILALLAVSAVFFGWGAAKSGFFIDEIYTYGLSNSTYAPFIDDAVGGTLQAANITPSVICDYLTVGEGEGFDPSSVFYNQMKDVHPPMYYLLINLVSSVFRGSCSKWIGLGLNFVLYTVTLFLLYRLSELLFSDRRVSVGLVLLYGLSQIGLSMGMMIRMYSLSTLLTLLLALLAVRFMREPEPIRAGLIGVVTCLGLLTHYYYVIFAALLCVSLMVWLFVKRRPRESFRYLLATVGGGVAAYVAFPSMMSHIFAEKLVSGGTALENIKNISAYPKSIAKYFLRTFADMLPALAVAAVFVLLFILLAVRKKNDPAFGDSAKAALPETLVLSVPAVLTVCAVAVISPVFTLRYIYNVVPVAMLLIGYFASVVLREARMGSALKKLSVSAAALSLAAVLLLSVVTTPDHFGAEHKRFRELLSDYTDSPCIYFSKNIPSAITQDMTELALFERVLVSNYPESREVADYITENKTADDIVVFVDTDKYWSSGFDATAYTSRLSDISGYDTVTHLYSFGLSQVYVLSHKDAPEN